MRETDPEGLRVPDAAALTCSSINSTGAEAVAAASDPLATARLLQRFDNAGLYSAKVARLDSREINRLRDISKNLGDIGWPPRRVADKRVFAAPRGGPDVLEEAQHRVDAQ